jgi:hypothetical protein
MSPRFCFRRATPEHIDSLISRLREPDRREAEAAGVIDLRARLLWTLEQPGDARALIDLKSGRTLAVLGAQEAWYGASPWMLCTDDIARAKRFSLKHVPRWVRLWAKKWGQLHNAVDKRNVMHQKFIERCGFSWAGEASINDHPFRVFSYVYR